MSNTFCEICNTLCDNDGSCACQPPKSWCETCKDIKNIDFCKCKIDNYIDEDLVEGEFYCSLCLGMHFGCDCGCGGDFYAEYPEYLESEEEKCFNCKNMKEENV